MPWPNNEAHNSPLKCWTRNEHYRTPGTACQPAEMAAAVGVQAKDGLLVVHQLNYLTLRPIHEHVPLAVEETVKGVGKIPGNLLHPQLVGVHRTASKVNSTRGNLHHE